MKKRIFGTILLMTVASFFCGCGYRLSGMGKNLPPTMKSVAIPIFKNTTNRYQIEQFVTFAVRDEFIRRSKLRLVEDAVQAEGVVEGEIADFSVKPLSLDSQGSARQYQVSITVGIRFIDNRTSEVLFEGKSISFKDTYETIYDDFFAQESQTLQKIAGKFADSVVSTILENY